MTNKFEDAKYKLTLDAKVKIMGRVYAMPDHSWAIMQQIHEAVKNGDLTVVASTSDSEYKKVPFDKDSTSTYDGCRSFELRFDYDVLVLDVTIFNGDMVCGEPTETRVKFTLTGDWQKVRLLHDIVESRWHDHCTALYEAQKYEEEQAKIKALGKTLLKSHVTLDHLLGELNA